MVSAADSDSELCSVRSLQHGFELYSPQYAVLRLDPPRRYSRRRRATNSQNLIAEFSFINWKSVAFVCSSLVNVSPSALGQQGEAEWTQTNLGSMALRSQSHTCTSGGASQA